MNKNFSLNTEVFEQKGAFDKDKTETGEIEIVRLASDGSGVGYLGGKATFVSGLLPGERGKVKVIEQKKKYQRAEIIETLKTVPQRQKPPCQVFGECGGCDLQHMEYANTLFWKRQWVEDALRRIGGLSEISVETVIGMEKPWRYRNKAVLHRDEKGRFGYYKEKSNQVVEFRDCLLLSTGMNRKIGKFREVMGDSYPGIKTATFRRSNRGKSLVLLEGSVMDEAQGDKMIKSFRKEPEFFPEACTVSVPAGSSFKGSGPQFLNEYIDDIRFRVSPEAFLQVNPVQTKVLYDLVLKYAELTGREEVWDLYCGIGTITLMLAKRCRKVIGFEENPHAVEDGILNAKENRITNTRFLQGKVEDRLKAFSGNPDIVVTDPPRAGMHPQVIERLKKTRPQKIIYVSCNPATLARDLKLLTAADGKQTSPYHIEKVQPVDMFPWTGHVECVTLMSRVEK